MKDQAVRLADTGVFVVPTLSVTASMGGEAMEPEMLEAAGDTPVSSMQRQTLAGRFSGGDAQQASKAGDVAIENVRRLHAAGVPLLAGTDAPNPGTASGLSLHGELRLLRRAGLSGTEVLAAATSVPAGIREVERISRGGLREIREAVTGLRRADLDTELANARLACEASGVSFTLDRPALDLSPDRQAVLALCLREAVTNVVRHAAAGRCRASLVREGGWIRLTVQDDGRGGVIREGAGLAGMRERVEQAGGAMAIENGRGDSLTVRIPVDPEYPPSRLPASGEAAA